MNALPETVVLLHGLGRTSGSMRRLARALEAAGYACRNIGYPSRHAPVEILADAIFEEIARTIPSDTPAIHFVTHSMGGIIVRVGLMKHRPKNLGRVVMLAPPNHGSEVIDNLRNLVSWLNGPASLQLSTAPDSLPNRLPPADYPVGIIAGSRSVDLWFNPFFDGVHDGKVSADSARLEGMSDYRLVPVSHPFLPTNGGVRKEVLHFLKHGVFQEGVDR